MKIVRKIIFVFIFLLIIVNILTTFFKRANLLPVKAQMDNMDLSSYDKLMIITHPADETLWGGDHLIKDNYLVVCISCGIDDKKVNEINRVLDKTNDKLVMMGYSDKYLRRSDYRRIRIALKKILNYKNWNLIVTHNPDGEYGNHQHKQVSEIVSKLKIDNLYYFGKYYDKKIIDDISFSKKISEKSAVQKEELLKNYSDKGINRHKHMIPFESWIKRDGFKK